MVAPALTPDRRGASSRGALLASARKLFAALGFHGTSVGDIADAAGLRKPSLFHHFPTKEALYRAVMEELFAQVAAVIQSGAMVRGSHLERLDAMNEALVMFFAAHPDGARLLFREALEPGAVMKNDGVAQAIGVMKAAEHFLDEGVAAGEFARQDTRHLLLSLTGIHLTYFAIAPLASPYLGASITDASMARARCEEVCRQARAMVRVD